VARPHSCAPGGWKMADRAFEGKLGEFLKEMNELLAA
jgi:hypothetical protein